MNKHISYLLISMLLSACVSAPSVYQDYDRSRSFNDYQTFSWAHNPPLVVSGDLQVSKEIEVKATLAIKEELKAKGFRYVEQSDDATFLVAYTLGARTNAKVYQTGSSVYDNKENWLWGKQYHSYYFDMVVHEDLRAEYTKGVIAIDIFDAKLKSPIWHGKASKSLDESEISPDGGSVGDAVKAVLSNFPPTQ